MLCFFMNFFVHAVNKISPPKTIVFPVYSIMCCIILGVHNVHVEHVKRERACNTHVLASFN